MPTYMTQFAYTADALADLVKHPEDRKKEVEHLIQQLGGEVISFYWAFGDKDGLVIYEADDNVTAAASSLAAVAPGHLKASETTVLLDSAERLEALEKASQAAFREPGG